MKLISDCTECGNGIYENDLLEIIEKGHSKNGFVAEESNINIYKCSKCNNELYAIGENEQSQFELMALEQQVEHINKLLETMSLTKACTSVGIARKTLSGKFERSGYKLDKTIKQYIKTTGSNGNNGNDTTVITKTTEKAQNKRKSSNSNKTLENRVDSLEKELEELKTIITTITTGSNSSNNTTELNIKVFEGEKKARSYKLTKEVQQQFKAFCKAHSEYAVGDILATAMLEFMNKYK